MNEIMIWKKKTTYRDQCTDKGRMVLFQDLIVRAFKAYIELELGVLLQYRQRSADVPKAP